MENELYMDQNSNQPPTQGDSIIKKYILIAWEFVKIILIAAVIVLPIRYFIFQPFVVKGDSMVPNFHSGDYLIVDEFSFLFNAPTRGNVVVLKYPLDESQRFIKRVIGLPGETVDITNGKVTITTKEGKQITLNELGYLSESLKTEGQVHVALNNDEYFVMGDNRNFSYDSRKWGILPKRDIVGKAAIRLFPITQISLIKTPTY